MLGGFDMSITPDVIERTRRFEGVIPYMYLDTGGNVTVGVGHLLSDRAAAGGLSFVDKLSDVLADEIQKSAEWLTVSELEPGHAAGYYAASTKLMLRVSDIDSLLRGDLTVVEGQLRGQFPDYDTYPQQAQAGLIDMGFNLGVHKLISKFPIFVGAVRDKNWATAAAECHRKAPISDERNDAVKQLFLDAAGGSPESDPGLA
jgi:GH24 family phage-related lysozyme (muramidase)